MRKHCGIVCQFCSWIFLIEASGNLLYTLMLWKNEIFSRYIKSCQNWLTSLHFARLWLFNWWNIFSPMWPNLKRTSSMLLWFHWTKEKQRYHWYWCKWQIENSRNSAKQAFEKEHSMEEVLERPTGYPKVGGSNHGSGDFSLQPQRNPYLS